MRKTIILSIFIFFSFLFISRSIAQEDPLDSAEIRKATEIEQNWRMYLLSKAALVEALVFKRDSRPDYHGGSSFLVFVEKQEDGTYAYFLTNPHVIDQDELRIFDKSTVVFVELKGGMRLKAEIIPQEVGWLIESLILKVKVPDDFDVSPMEISDYPDFMETVWIVGFPQMEPAVIKGYAIAFQTDKEMPVPYFLKIRLEGFDGPGASGSMVVTNSGKVVGIVYASNEEGHVVLAVPGNLIKEFLNKNMPSHLFFGGGP